MASIYYKGNKYFGGTGRSYGGDIPPASNLGSDGDYYYLMDDGVASIIYVKINGTWIEVYGGDVIIEGGDLYYADDAHYAIIGENNIGMEGVMNE